MHGNVSCGDSMARSSACSGNPTASDSRPLTRLVKADTFSSEQNPAAADSMLVLILLLHVFRKQGLSCLNGRWVVICKGLCAY